MNRREPDAFMESISTFRLIDGKAEVMTDRSRFTVARRDGETDAGVCPGELVIAALGS